MTQLIQCPDCPKHFRFQRAFEVHFRTHTGERPFGCPQCDVRFTQNSHLTRHTLLVHQGHKPFACEECGKRFGERASLTNHTRIHSNERIPCDQCDKTFSHPSTLQMHIRLHADPTPFLCAECPTKFSQRVNMHRHMRNKHGRVAPAAAAAAVVVE